MNGNSCDFSYFISPDICPIPEDSDLLKTPVPMNRSHTPGTGIFLSHGAYFRAVQDFLEKEGLALFRKGINSESAEHIEIFMEKHGELYHPARIEFSVNGKNNSVAVNVAVSDIGKQYIREEYRLLKQLNAEFPFAFLPEVYAEGSVMTEDGIEILMFSGEWFAGYHEFHLSHDPADNRNKILVWDFEQGSFFLTADQTAQLYCRVAEILTAYYNMESFAHIYPWHHAAGDFVIKIGENQNVDLKLITARGYKARSAAEDRNPAAVLESLLVFLLQLSIRTRLDRLDGVKEMAWADDIAAEATVKGFSRALALKPECALLPAPAGECFRYYLSRYSESELFEWTKAIADAYPPAAPEFSVIKKHLKDHTAALYRSLKNIT